jgi:hypothetical protein
MPTAPRSQALDEARPPRCRPPMTTASAPSPSPSCTPTANPAHEARAAEIARRDRLRPDLGQPRGLAADQAGRARRHHRGRCLPLADPAPLCRPGRRCARWARPGCERLFMQSNRRADRRDCSRARTRSCPARPAASSAWSRPGNGRVRQAHRLRHGRHLHRCLPLCRRL